MILNSRFFIVYICFTFLARFVSIYFFFKWIIMIIIKDYKNFKFLSIAKLSLKEKKNSIKLLRIRIRRDNLLKLTQKIYIVLAYFDFQGFDFKREKKRMNE